MDPGFPAGGGSGTGVSVGVGRARGLRSRSVAMLSSAGCRCSQSGWTRNSSHAGFASFVIGTKGFGRSKRFGDRSIFGSVITGNLRAVT